MKLNLATAENQLVIKLKTRQNRLPTFSLGYFWNHWKYTAAAYINHIAYITLWSVQKKATFDNVFGCNHMHFLLIKQRYCWVLRYCRYSTSLEDTAHTLLGATLFPQLCIVAGVRHADNCIISPPLWLKPFSSTNQQRSGRRIMHNSKLVHILTNQIQTVRQ